MCKDTVTVRAWVGPELSHSHAFLLVCHIHLLSVICRNTNIEHSIIMDSVLLTQDVTT